MPLEAREIVAPAAQLMLVALLVSLTRSDERDAVPDEPGGVTPASRLTRLAQLSLVEIHRLAERGAFRVVVDYERDQVVWSLQSAARRRAERALLEYFVRHGAPRTLVRQLFSISRERIDATRKELHLASIQGRPKLPPVRERAMIVAAWSELTRAVSETRARYIALHRKFPRYTIAALDAALREASPGPANAIAPPGKRLATPPESATQGGRQSVPAPAKRPVVHRRVPR